ncbi:MAG: hypothetical protein NTX25_05910, partial [Proteobacteria bacterium]|nr:hypothetical protein [Pseudomonadota bacterium]
MAQKPRDNTRRAQDSIRPKQLELLYYGLHICKTLVAQRRQSIIRVYCTEDLVPSLGELLRWCAAQRKAYHIVTHQDLEKITGSVHH